MPNKKVEHTKRFFAPVYSAAKSRKKKKSAPTLKYFPSDHANNPLNVDRDANDADKTAVSLKGLENDSYN